MRNDFVEASIDENSIRSFGGNNIIPHIKL